MKLKRVMKAKQGEENLPFQLKVRCYYMASKEQQLETLRKIRRNWGDVKPYTRIELDKKKYRRKKKHKKKNNEEN